MLLVSEEFVNRTKGYRFGDSEPQESFTDNMGRLFRFLQKEYGRCEGHVYVDTADGTKAIGWVFVKRAQYDDCKDTYLQEAWVTLHTHPDKHKTICHYHFLPL